MTADLVLLDSNPLEDIANTRTVVAVILRGRLLARAKLDALLDEVAGQAAAPWKSRIDTVAVPREQLAAYAGSYRVPSSGLVVWFMFRNDGLKVTAEGMPVIDLRAKSLTHFFFLEDDTTFEFEQAESGVSPSVRVHHSNGRSERAMRVE